MVLNRCATDYTPIYTSVTLVLNWFGSKPVEHRLTNRCWTGFKPFFDFVVVPHRCSTGWRINRCWTGWNMVYLLVDKWFSTSVQPKRWTGVEPVEMWGISCVEKWFSTSVSTRTTNRCWTGWNVVYSWLKLVFNWVSTRTINGLNRLKCGVFHALKSGFQPVFN